jgi:TRAP-type C4-dicarboxylate transport system substrate-binding protein
MKFNLLLVLILHLSSVFASVDLKMAVLVPEDTTWGESLKKFAKEVELSTKGEVKFKIYYGGVAGDEPDVLRKVRVGQMNGGIFTGKILGEIHGDLRVMEIPFSFYKEREKAWGTLKKLTPEFNKALVSKGFVNLGFYEVGQVYLISSKKVENLESLKGLKIWAWEGDPLVAAMLESMKLVSVPLSITDVLSSLSTGIIDSAYSSPLGILALQWHSKVKYLLDFPLAYSIGALLINQKDWKKIKPDVQTKIISIADKFVEEANKQTVNENEQAKDQLKKIGIEFLSFPQKDYDHATSLRVEVINKLKNKIFSQKALDSFESHRK